MKKYVLGLIVGLFISFNVSAAAPSAVIAKPVLTVYELGKGITMQAIGLLGLIPIIPVGDIATTLATTAFNIVEVPLNIIFGRSE